MQLCKLMGHTDIRTTQVYAKIVDSKKIEAVGMITNCLSRKKLADARISISIIRYNAYYREVKIFSIFVASYQNDEYDDGIQRCS